MKIHLYEMFRNEEDGSKYSSLESFHPFGFGKFFILSLIFIICFSILIKYNELLMFLKPYILSFSK